MKGCPECPPSAIAVTQHSGLKDATIAVATIVVVVVLVAVVAVLVQRWHRASVARRRTLRPVFVSCGIALSLLLATVAIDRLDNRAYSVVWVLFLVSFAAVPLTFLAGVLRSRFDQAAATRMLLSLDAGVPLRDALAAGPARPIARDRLPGRQPQPVGGRRRPPGRRARRHAASLDDDDRAERAADRRPRPRPRPRRRARARRLHRRRRAASRSRTCGCRPISARSS